MPWIGWIIALVVLILCILFAVIGKVPAMIAFLIGALAFAMLCWWPPGRPFP